eukprot:TRINITY_DN11676_c0_g1_i2.p1 TRINITY_DN11676_c0_g1~~TRINITY_DN11676_c0_g1_i2.p1  ORF type:complete len:172 (-),score=29.82 TRINITY_DN11676_c0_g1_i2:152-667(-)
MENEQDLLLFDRTSGSTASPREVGSEDVNETNEQNVMITGNQFMRQHEFINHPQREIIMRSLKLQPETTMDFFAYLKTMNLFNVTGPLDIKLTFMCKLWDPEDRGWISRDGVKKTLRKMTGHELSSTELREIVDVIFFLVDQDDDGQISYAEFIKVVGRTDVAAAISINHI